MNLKIGFFGPSSKINVVMRFLKGKYTEGYIPTIDDEFSKMIEVDNQQINLSIVDTAGQDDFEELKYSYFNQIQGLVLFYDISNPDTILVVKRLYLDMLDAIEGSFFCIIGGLNSDLRNRKDVNQEDLIPLSEVTELSNELKCPIIEVSAKTGENIDNLIFTLVRKILNKEENEVATDIDLFTNLKGEWNIGLYNKNKSVAYELANRYVFGEFVYDEINDNDYVKIIEIDNDVVPLNLHVFDSVDNFLIKRIQVAVLILNIEDPKSVDEIKSVYKNIMDLAQNDLFCVIIANHCELRENNRKVVSAEDCRKLEIEYNLKVFEVLSDTVDIIDDIFFEITKQLARINKMNKLKKHRIKKEKKSKDKKKKKYSLFHKT